LLVNTRFANIYLCTGSYEL